jgi:hypothetical protein
MANEQLINFYLGKGRDARGRTLEEIRGFSRDDLENVHDYIQWLFPLTERSAFNPDAPLLDAETIDRFRTDPMLRREVERSLDTILAFYFGEREHPWLTPYNHNFLRLTRILKSLTLLGLGDRAKMLLTQLEEIYRAHPALIGVTTLQYWRRAVEP